MEWPKIIPVRYLPTVSSVSVPNSIHNIGPEQRNLETLSHKIKCKQENQAKNA